ncbi:MAG TPA: helix-turn-helix transcriptional regulator [Gaiellaceae bacterium]|nr:helix-turn-helix transcriptional regulator [Gaiellaceae bacterium]
MAQLLQEHREGAGYSRAKIGELLEISPGTIEGWELGRVERPPLHDALRLAKFLQISYDELVAAVTADTPCIPRQSDVSSAGKARPRKALGAIPLLEAAFRLYRWNGEHDAAAVLDVTPEQVRGWRRGSEPMNVVDYLSLTAIVNLGVAEALQSAGASAFDLAGATESLGLRMAET